MESYLAKMMEDPFSYLVRLQSGDVFHVGYAVDIGDGWLRLVPSSDCPDIGWAGPGSIDLELPSSYVTRPCFDRGVDVRAERIVWVADAPYGS